MTAPTDYARCKGCGAKSDAYKIITHEPMCNAILKKPTPDHTLLDSKMEQWIIPHSDDCAIDVSGEDYPCICRRAQAKSAINNLLLEARLSEHNYARDNSYGSPNSGFMNLDVKAMDKRLAELQEMLNG